MAGDRHPFLGPWFEVLDQLEDAVIVIDELRMLRHANSAARRLLGHDSGATFGGRCRLTTRGVDCEQACPLTYALASGLDRVERFPTVYRAADGRGVALDVTIIPLRDEDGRFVGAVEILRPTEPPPGFFMCGRSERARGLRRRAREAAQSGADLVIVGEAHACLDVARAIHRFSGLPEELFHSWRGSWDGVRAWPPGAVYADGPHAWPELDRNRHDGWRVMVGARSGQDLPPAPQVLELPSLESLAEDLPLMLAAWVEQLSPGTAIAPAALERLAATAGACGLDAVQTLLVSALATAGDRLEPAHLSLDGSRVVLLDELLQADRPLAALERRLLSEVIEMSGWRMQEAADRLGISRVTLWRKMKDLGIDRP